MNDPGLRLAKVVAVYPGGYSVDLKFYDDGSQASNVQVLSGRPVSTSTGVSDMPTPDVPAGGSQWSMQDTKTTDMIGVVGFVRGVPVVVGFLYPQVNQMLFSDKDRMVYRHKSGVYFTIDKDGNLEMCHPSGAYIRFGDSPDHEDLTGKDFDGKWKIPTTEAVSIRVAQAGGKAVITISPSGDIAISSDGDISFSAVGEFTVSASKINLN